MPAPAIALSYVARVVCGMALVVQTVLGAEDTVSTETMNLVRNPSIEDTLDNSRTPSWWQPFINDYQMTSSWNSHTGDTSLIFRLYNSNWVGCGQLIPVNQKWRSDLELSTWGSGVDLAEGQGLAIYADIRYNDGTSSLDHTLPLGANSFPWIRRSIILHAEKPVSSVMIYIIMEGIPDLGSGYIDDVSLVELLRAPPSFQILMNSRRVYKPNTFWCVPGSVCDTDYHTFHMHNHFLVSTLEPTHDDISLVTQCSPDRLERVQQLARLWKGPMSVAVYVGQDNFKGVARLLSLWENSALVRKYVDFHLVSVDARELVGEYPINALRNLAWESARTDQLFLLDVDFMPNPSMREYVRKLWPRLRNVKGLERKVAYIVPGFETTDGKQLTIWPKSRKDVVESVGAYKLQPVHADKLLSAHAAVNYDRWYTTKNPYKVSYRLYFEPYMLVDRKDTPKYDRRFSGYGHDKSSHTFQLYLEGFQFVVLPEAFVVHIDHGVPSWRNTANKTRIWTNWYAFALEKEASLGEGKKKLYFAPGPFERHKDPAAASRDINNEKLESLKHLALSIIQHDSSKTGGVDLSEKHRAIEAWKLAIKDIESPSEVSLLRDMVELFWKVDPNL